MNTWKNIIKPIVVLVLITLVVSAALAITYQFTKVEDTGPDVGIINTLKEKLMPQADEFEVLEKEAEGAQYLFKAKNNAGIVVQAETKGYNGSVPIVFLVGFDKDGSITGLSVLEHQESPNIGDAITKDEFAQQFIGKTGEVGVKTGDAGSIDGITGATLSSKGMCAGVNKARGAFEAVKGELS